MPPRRWWWRRASAIRGCSSCDLIVSGGDPAVLANDLAIIGNATQGVTLAATPVTQGTVPVMAGVFANAASIEATGSTTTPVVFDAYLTGTLSQAATITWSALAPGAGLVTAAGYGASCRRAPS